MPIYAGSRIRIDAVVTNYDKTVLVPPAVTAVTISIKGVAGTFIVTAAAMTWNALFVNDDGTLGAFQYVWDTPAVEGAYTAAIYATGPAILTHNFKVIRLRRNKDIL